MRTADFDFDLPPERIAQFPVEPRDRSRLLVWDPSVSGEPIDSAVTDLGTWLRKGDLLVVNDTRVIPARVLGTRATGGRVELLFLEPLPGAGAGVWRAMARPAKKLREGERVSCAGGVSAVLIRREEDSGYWLARLEPTAGKGQTLPEDQTVRLMSVAGAVPLPPYIDRPASAEDLDRYQTVYAKEPGAVAAPTAGLHFTPELLERMGAMGVAITHVTLHVGAGTFLPVTSDVVEDHRMHSERFTLPADAAAAVRACRERGGRVIAIGTTSARVLESCATRDPRFESALVEAKSGATDIFLRPGSGPQVCDGLFTNFHLPKSTLLMLVASFIGLGEMRELYRAAIDREYRFYSYGDASLLLPRGESRVVTRLSGR